MTVQELQEIMIQRFEALERHTAERFEALERHIAERFEAQDRITSERFEALEKRQDRLETRMDRMETKLDKVLEFVAIQHGERAFAVRFWKHAAWIAPTVIALAALIKSFLL